MRHEWHRWESWEDPESDPETTFDDLMIDHLGNFFGSMNHPNPSINKDLREAVDTSEKQVAGSLGISVEEFRQVQVAQLLREIEQVKNEIV